MRRRQAFEPTEILQIVLDDPTVDRLRAVAEVRGIEVEQLIVQIIHRASWEPDVYLPVL